MIRTYLLIATLYPPIDNSLVALSGRMNIVGGTFPRPKRRSRDTDHSASPGRRTSDADDHDNAGDLSAGTRSECDQASHAETGIASDSTTITVPITPCHLATVRSAVRY